MGGTLVVMDPASWADCERLVEALPIGEPFTIEAFLTKLGQQRGKPIELVSAPLGATAPCGLLARTDEVDYILCVLGTSKLHEWHIVFHEVGHLETGHGHPVTLAPNDDDLEALRTYMPDLSPSLIRRLLSRTNYAQEEELVAEQFATLAGRRLHRMIRARGSAVRRDVDVDQLRTLFDVSRPDDRG